MDPIGSLILDKAEMKRMRDREKIRRRGHKFIKVVNTGRLNRIHSVDDVRVYEVANSETGDMEHTTRIESAVLDFQYDGMTGDMSAHVLDTERNRFFLARHLYLGLEIENDKVRAEVEALVDKPYKVELAPLDELKRKKADLQREIKAIEGAESDTEAAEMSKTGTSRSNYRSRSSVKPEDKNSF